MSIHQNALEFEEGIKDEDVVLEYERTPDLERGIIERTIIQNLLPASFYSVKASKTTENEKDGAINNSQQLLNPLETELFILIIL